MAPVVSIIAVVTEEITTFGRAIMAVGIGLVLYAVQDILRKKRDANKKPELPPRS